jgi:hypothetical protein
MERPLHVTLSPQINSARSAWPHTLCGEPSDFRLATPQFHHPQLSPSCLTKHAVSFAASLKGRRWLWLSGYPPPTGHTHNVTADVLCLQWYSGRTK